MNRFNTIAKCSNYKFSQ